MKKVKLLASAALFAVVASTLGGCYVSTRPAWRPYHRAVIVVR
jgi:hypothetical protein